MTETTNPTAENALMTMFATMTTEDPGRIVGSVNEDESAIRAESEGGVENAMENEAETEIVDNAPVFPILVVSQTLL